MYICFSESIFSDFQPIKILFPKISTEKVLNLTSELDHEIYQCSIKLKNSENIQHFSIESTFFVENKTDSSISLYTNCENLHWKLMSPKNLIDNPFENCIKVKDLPCHSIFSIPLALTKDANFSLKPSDQK